jgi:6-pyruvoyl-tetrahydropterin synthase
MSEKFEVLVAERLAATRMLTGFTGKLAAKHEHVYRLEFLIETSSIDQYGITADFDGVHKVISEAIADMQGAYLNEVADFANQSEGEGINPTDEVVARVVWDRVYDKVAAIAEGFKLTKIYVCENANGKIAYSRTED